MRKSIMVTMLCSIALPVYATTSFETTWSNSTGGDCAAVSDGALWNNVTYVDDSPISVCQHHYSEQGNLEVQNDGPEGENALHIWVNNASFISFMEEPSVINSSGEYTFLRAYFRIAAVYRKTCAGDGYCCGAQNNQECSNIDYHFFEDYHNAENWWLNVANAGTTTWTASTWSLAQDAAYDWGTGNKFILKNLPIGEWLRFEMKIHWLESRDSSTQTHTYYRVYDSSDTLVADTSDWVMVDTETTDLQEFYDGGDYMLWDSSSPTRRSLKIGNNGPASNSRTGDFIQVAAVKITDGPGANDWIGAIGGGGDTTPPAKPTGLAIIE